MKPAKFTVFELFERERRYLVPLYQRPYVWNEADQWEPLWLDIAEKADTLLDPSGSHDGPRNHFLGAVVLNHVETYGKEVAADDIIDGQQRLTTLQIFIAALRDLASRAGDTRLASGLVRVTEHDCLMEHEHEEFKVWPTNADRAAFQSVMTARSAAEVMRRHPQRYSGRTPIPRERLAEAYLFFSERIEAYCRTGEAVDPMPSGERLTALFQVLRRHLQLVVIELERDDDPQVIFETLNARGAPLLPSDLIRNFTFLQATRGSEEVDDLYRLYWQQYDEEIAEPGAETDDPFWKQPEQQGRLKRPRIDLFIFHYLTYQAERDINITHLFQEYREWWARGRKTRNVAEELATLQAYSRIFHDFFLPDPETRLGEFIARLRILDTTTVYPVLLFLLSKENGVPFGEVDGILTDLESFLVRRMVCGLTTKNYNRLFLSLLKRMRAAERVDRMLVREELTSGTGDAVRWPDDKEFASRFLSVPAYTQLKPHRVSMILQAIERQLRTAKQENVRIVSKLAVEHVMPQGYRLEEYPFPPAEESVLAEERLARREALLHTFGNLTLVTTPLNSALGNASFARKQAEFGHSVLRLNAYFREEPTGIWDEHGIFRRGLDLLFIAQGIWPHP
jgi:hypothetical protein